jgi:hypothetical protein
MCGFEPSLEPLAVPILKFTLENGAETIRRWLHSVTLHRYDDGLVVSEPEPLAAYVLSVVHGRGLDEESLVKFIEREIEEHGPVHITKDVGLFEAE